MRTISRRHLSIALVAAIVGAIAVANPSVVTATARSPRALAVIGLAVVATSLASRFAARRWGIWPARAIRVGSSALLVVLLLVPALRQTELDEPLPTTSAATAASLPAGVAAAAPGPAPSVATPVEPATAQRLTSGSLRGIGHDATADVSVHRLGDGSVLVRFEGADIKGAPDPVLYLVPGKGRTTRDGGTEIGPLRATKGNFNEPVTVPFDFEQPFTVFIWCEQYATPIAAADQAA